MLSTVQELYSAGNGSPSEVWENINFPVLRAHPLIGLFQFTANKGTPPLRSGNYVSRGKH